MEFVGYIESVYDSFLVAEAGRLGQIKLLDRRPTLDEKTTLFHGKTVIFEENSSGIKRWTDGKCWSNSKLKNGFFIYQEILDSPSDRMNVNFLINQRKLTKKAIKVKSGDSKCYTIVNYFYEEDVKSLTMPSNYPFKDLVYISENIKYYSYIKCFRSSSKAYRQPNKVLNSLSKFMVERAKSSIGQTVLTSSSFPPISPNNKPEFSDISATNSSNTQGSHDKLRMENLLS